jgi:predicted methyltransferase
MQRGISTCGRVHRNSIRGRGHCLTLPQDTFATSVVVQKSASFAAAGSSCGLLNQSHTSAADLKSLKPILPRVSQGLQIGGTRSRSRRHPIETVICRHRLGINREMTEESAQGGVMLGSNFPRTGGALVLFLLALAPGLVPALAQQAGQAPDYEAIVAASDRSDADRQTDQRRQPAKMLAFAGVMAGMKVLDMEANAGYSTELIARAVGPTGVVYAQDPASIIERFVKDKFDTRAQKPAMKNVVHVIRDFDDPIPPDVANLDMITFFFAYHDVTYMPVDRAKMNQKMFAALKPGGYLVIADHSAKPGDGTSVGKTLHRIEESTLRQEIEAAGFKFVAEGDFLHHPEDPRDVPVFKPAVPVDEFVLKFQKPS